MLFPPGLIPGVPIYLLCGIAIGTPAAERQLAAYSGWTEPSFALAMVLGQHFGYESSRGCFYAAFITKILPDQIKAGRESGCEAGSSGRRSHEINKNKKVLFTAFWSIKRTEQKNIVFCFFTLSAKHFAALLTNKGSIFSYYRQ
jgi:hypothetical protein